MGHAFTAIRDAVESVGSVVGNYYLPGSSMITDQLVSKGSQEQLSSPLGQLAQLGSGLAGAGVLENIPGMNGWGISASPGILGANGWLSNATGIGSSYGGTPDTSSAIGGLSGPGVAGSAQPGMSSLGGPSFDLSTASTGMAGTDPTWKKMLGSFGMGGGTQLQGQQGGGGIGSLMLSAAGLYGLSQSGKNMPTTQQAQQAQAAADPYAQYRAQAAQQLQALQADPSSVTSAPGYQAGMDAVQRSMAANGYLGSGNMMAAMSQYGQNAYQQQFNNLSSLSGAGQSPAIAAEVGLQGYANAGNAQSSNLMGQGMSLAMLGKGLGIF